MNLEPSTPRTVTAQDMAIRYDDIFIISPADIRTLSPAERHLK
jgi:hypothetical protein